MNGIVPIGSPDTLPKKAPYRSARQKYPWNDLKPGEWFKFAENVKPGSARNMATQMGNALAVKYNVFAAEDGFIYCRRVDGLPSKERWAAEERDEQGNVVLPKAAVHSATEAMPAPVDDGRDYGYGGDNHRPMPGEKFNIAGHVVEGSGDAEDIEI